MKKIKGVRNFVGVRFWPGGAIPFLRDTAVNFTDDIVTLDSVWGEQADIISERVYMESSPVKKIEIIENKLLDILKDVDETDYIIKLALHKILTAGGAISINQLAREVDISQRHLSRKFKNWIGISPKKFCNIVKFQNIINELNKQAYNSSNIDWVNIALKNGYYDQAHFIREFKKLYGKTPGHI